MSRMETGRKEDRKTERQKDRKTERQKDRKTERQKDRKTERQKDRKTERLKDRKTFKKCHNHRTNKYNGCKYNAIKAWLSVRHATMITLENPKWK